ncbi:uncharacterized protein c19h1orf216 isoform X1 [Hippocampus comes]|uniref:uncharacterized protein c19h1orf216 isoform X1 n=1 Tax=Hippocampus comes TaxID=109280 RepID=UPI00094E2694|nr:PREDICTED: UPF0500 protein C1orf216 homolog isoform X1 [Hippocampus comes]
MSQEQEGGMREEEDRQHRVGGGGKTLGKAQRRSNLPRPPSSEPGRSENQSRPGMLHQDQPLAYGGQNTNRSSSSVSSRKYDQDGNHNFLTGNGRGRGDENQNPHRPSKLGPLTPDLKSSPSNSGILSPRSRMPCWSTLEPLPEIEYSDDSYGRVPPDGAEERRMEEEEGQMMTKHREKMEFQRRKSSNRGRDDLEEMMKLENDDEWGDSGSDSDSGGSMSSIRLERGGNWLSTGGLERMAFGEQKLSRHDSEPTRSKESSGKRRSFSRNSISGSHMEDLLEEGAEERHDQSSDSDGELPEMMDAVWTLRDRERFKAQEMEKHQVQLTMYRRLALIRWLRTLQGRVEEQQNRLQSSFDIILTHRKELLRMGAAVVNPPPPAAVGQS